MPAWPLGIGTVTCVQQTNAAQLYIASIPALSSVEARQIVILFAEAVWYPVRIRSQTHFAEFRGLYSIVWQQCLLCLHCAVMSMTR